MKEVKYREFVRDFARWIKAQEPLKIVGMGGPMGYWVPDSQSKGMSALLMANQAHSMAQKNFEAEKVTPVAPVSDEVKTCDKCEKSPAAWRGLVFHEGEQVEVEICQACYRKYSPQGFKRM